MFGECSTYIDEPIPVSYTHLHSHMKCWKMQKMNGYIHLMHMKKQFSNVFQTEIFTHWRIPIIPVSYTHLDVYKRQGLYIPRFFTLLNSL